MTDECAELIRKHEGTRLRLYKDSLGKLTGGVGHHFYEGDRLSPAVVERLFRDDILEAQSEYRKLNLDLDEVREAVLINMIFNMGLPTVKKFRHMLEAVRVEDWSAAAREMLDSKWAHQVGRRAVELAEMMKTGEWPEGV